MNDHDHDHELLTITEAADLVRAPVAAPCATGATWAPARGAFASVDESSTVRLTCRCGSTRKLAFNGDRRIDGRCGELATVAARAALR